MAAQQQSISVSEFFTKNRHLLGFDNPRKALLTTVKEAVDNSIDACEEAGISPELWVEIEPAGNNRFKVAIQDNGPGIVKKQIPLIFGKLLYGSKFHRLRMSRGQQGIGISAAGMYGQLTTGKPIKIVSKISIRKPAHYFEIQINTKTNNPEILNGKGDGEDIPPGEKGDKYCEKKGIHWISEYPVPVADEAENSDHTEPKKGKPVSSGTRVTIELEGSYKRGKGSVDEYLEQTAIANPHVTIHYVDPDRKFTSYHRSTTELPPEPKEIKPHPYGVELGRLFNMIKAESNGSTLSQFLTSSFSRVSPAVARRICEAAKLSSRASIKKIGRNDADKLYQAIQDTKIGPPSTDCIIPIGEELILKGLYHVVPGEFFVAATRPPAVYRGNPFQIEVGLAYGGTVATKKVSREELEKLVDETDARTIKQFLVNSFDGLGPDGADKIVAATNLGKRQSPSKLKAKEIAELYHALQDVSVGEGQTMQLLRYANRVPLQFKMGDCAITKTIMSTNWRSYGMNQSRGSMPNGPLTVMVHMASVWVPFTSESKEAVAAYPEIEKEIRLAIQAVGRKLGMFMRRRKTIKQEGERRSVFLRYLGEVATAVSEINGANRQRIYDNLLRVAERKTREADTQLDKHGKKIDVDDQLYGKNVLIVDTESPPANGKTSVPHASQKSLFDEDAQKAGRPRKKRPPRVRKK